MINAMQVRSIGGRIREIRVWRDMSLKATAELAGITESYLSRIERNQRPVNSRSLLEAIAAALRVEPSELAGQPFPPATVDPVASETQAAVVALDAALSDYKLGEPTGEPTRPRPAVAADLDRLNTVLRPAIDYASQGALLPGLMTELHTLYVTDPQHRVEVCMALMDCYHTAGVLLKNLGVLGLPALTAFRAQQIAEELDDPAWLGLATWLRASTLGSRGRLRMLAISVQGAHALEPYLDDPRAAQMYGALHLNAALTSATMRRNDDAADHLNEAAAMAERISGDGRGFGNLYFGPDNVGIWRLSIAVEMGEVGRAREIAKLVDPSRVPSAARQAMFWADLGRGITLTRSCFQCTALETPRPGSQSGRESTNSSIDTRAIYPHMITARQASLNFRNSRSGSVATKWACSSIHSTLSTPAKMAHQSTPACSTATWHSSGGFRR